MAYTIYSLEKLIAAGTTFILDGNTRYDWLTLTGDYPDIPGLPGPVVTMRAIDPVYGIATHVTVFTDPETEYTLTIVGAIENATGSFGDDFIDGNGQSNDFYGEIYDTPGGADSLYGNGGMTSLLVPAAQTPFGAATIKTISLATKASSDPDKSLSPSATTPFMGATGATDWLAAAAPTCSTAGTERTLRTITGITTVPA